jgi:hypothetical protein
VFDRLFVKLEERSTALGSMVFDVLGQAFEAQPLRKLLVEALRYSDLEERARVAHPGDRHPSRGGPRRAGHQAGATPRPVHTTRPQLGFLRSGFAMLR